MIMMKHLAQKLAELLGPIGWLSGADAAGYSRDWLNRYGEPPLGVARPTSTAEVAAVVAACHDAGVPLTPQGGNTGLCGAAMLGKPGGVILSLSRMTKIGRPDRAAENIEVEAGVVLAALHEALNAHGLIFPLHLGAEGSAQIGGLIGTNAGGNHALRYGMMQDLILGLEVVLPDGRVWNGLRAVQKDNSGYQLRRLFCGAEGTLGVVTRAVLKLYPAPRNRATALLTIPDVSSLLAFGKRLRADACEFISGMEFFCDFGLDMALRHVHGLSYPLQERAPWYLLVEMTAGSALVPLEQILEAALADGLESGEVLDGVVAVNDTQRATLWRLREEQPEGQRLEGTQLKHDVSVPPGRLAEFIEQASVLCGRVLPGVRVNPFGHLGDGNTHFNLTPPLGQSGFGELASEFAQRIGALAGSLGGSFAAEHGLGRSKVSLADALRSPEERSLMAAIKQAIDPGNLMNPGAVLHQ
ncbi:FAD-binding oxidoreductase [Paraburkholderia diazotrophica]|uniref:FAD/FMN-containing dehydrogenase n=1 Tax=Paraburkholderia diazotrophica TaxID=667676 RepID=A0A1H7EF45_9BURK|nr:FAD-binding oxidoreductase [Paraburkholderia diazotrophica]SEK12478.1 FAD/FMN-containing dehydrogenase [Paraburkholderia diazotrophica]